ncbi:hypothetical protein DENIS_0036 [Desulfonema ishimotonii]|uniref:Methyl-accepting transducer domain-containing protein n=1 Tax=Desulfonema ishimotonii TaxID=45657 RepID=A0A401FQ36_9BACT|nr:methyl-accepting chemotaxis protein [Desulfonema ishimotonii]GBC59106.1 hypothetical protein DENIS_0036 [Desulfonema ishimotonii]
MKQLSFFRSIPAKLLLIHLMNFIMFVTIIVVAFCLFHYTEETLTTVFSDKIDRVAENAQIGRELTRVIADTNLLMSRFYGREDILKTEGKRLLSETNALITKTKDRALKQALNAYYDKIQKLFNQCRIVNRIMGDIEARDRKISNMLTGLEETISEKIRNKIIEGKDVSVMEQLTFMTADYRATFPKITILFTKLGRKHFESSSEEEEKDCPLLILLDELRLKLRTLTAPAPDIIEHGKNLRTEVDRYRAEIVRFHEIAAKLKTRLDETDAAKDTLLQLMERTDKGLFQTVREVKEGLIRQIFSGLMAATLLMLLMALMVGVLAYFLNRSITRSISNIITGLQQSSVNTLNASGHVSLASHKLSEGTSQQAAFLEETAAALEEIDAKVSQNAASASRSYDHVESATDNIRQASHTIEDLGRSMQEISEASQEARKIISMIDGIAFQTNILALNAAVESARAGRAGAGFSVVAQEIRNLAMRTAAASKNTAEIIATALGKIQHGAKQVSQVGQTFGNMETDARYVRTRLKSVAGESDEQARGISQINMAVSELGGWSRQMPQTARNCPSRQKS